MMLIAHDELDQCLPVMDAESNILLVLYIYEKQLLSVIGHLFTVICELYYTGQGENQQVGY